MKQKAMNRPMPVRARAGAAVLMLAGLAYAGSPEPEPVADLRPNAVAFRMMRYGIFVTQTYGLTGWPDDRKSATLDEFADAFDVKTFAEQMESIGVEYVIFTAWHKSVYMLGPNPALEKWLPGHTAKRDLLGEIADALGAKKISLIIYAHPNDGHDLTPGEQLRIGYSNRAEDKGETLNRFVNEVFAELSQRYGRKPNVLGYWWDSWWYAGNPIDVPRMRATVLAAFPGAISLSNKFDPKFIDFYACEGGGPPPLEKMTALQDNQTFYLLGDWWSSSRNASWYGGRPVSPEVMYRFLLLNVGTGAPGGMSWALSPLADGKTWPGNNEPLRAMQALGRLIAPLRPTICGVLPSRNWRLPSGITWPKAPAFVAARSPDNRREYVHVMKPGADRFIDLPKPAETVSSARLYLGKREVAVSATAGGIRLTLPEDEPWSSLDTVIELTVDPAK